MSSENMTLFDRLLARLTKDGALSAVQQAEIDALIIEGEISKNDTFWVQFLPLYLNQFRVDVFKESDLLTGENSKLPKLDYDKLSEAIVARIEPDQIRAEVDSAVVARSVSKAAAPELQQIVTDTIERIKRDSSAPLDAATIRNEIAAGTKQAMLNSNVVIAGLVGLLMTVFVSWYVNYKADTHWGLMVKNQQAQISNLQKKLNETGVTNGNTKTP